MSSVEGKGWRAAAEAAGRVIAPVPGESVSVASSTAGRWRCGSGALAMALLLAAAPPGRAAPPKQAAAPIKAAAGPPQVLPLTSKLCVLKPSDTPATSPVCISLEEPRTPQQHAWGLMMRPPLPQRRGMWFAFQPPQPARFWMHRTPNPLDLVYIRDNRVVKIDRALPSCMRLPCPTYGTEEAVDGVLEIGAGQAEALGLAVGTTVRIEPLSAADR